MIPIECRAWHPAKKIMFSPEQMGRDQLTLMPDGSGFINVHSTSTSLSQLMPHMIPLQYTGLKDKNGKKIFEGDILEMEYGKAEVYFEDGCFKIRFDTDSDLLWLYCCKKDDTEVIGNIYQDKHLLEDK